MSHWISVPLAIFLALYALQQVRMFLIYQGRIHSPTIGEMEPNPVLSATAIRSAATSAVFVFLVLLVPWPKLLSYVTGVWTVRAVVDSFCCWCGTGVYSVTAPMLTDKGRRVFLLNSFWGVIGNAVLCAVCVYFFGY